MDSSQPVIRDFTPSPIEEPALKNKGSCFWKLVSLVITLIILSIIVFSVISILFSGPTIKRIASLPTHFPTDIPLYRFGDRSVIHYQNAKQNDKIFNRLAQIPKYLFGPIILKLQPDLSEEQKLLRNQIFISSSLKYDDFKKILQPTSSNKLDIIEIDWENLNEPSKKIFDFYKKNLTNQEYQIIKEETPKKEWRILFKKESIEGDLLIIENEDNDAVKKIILKIILPNQNK